MGVVCSISAGVLVWFSCVIVVVANDEDDTEGEDVMLLAGMLRAEIWRTFASTYSRTGTRTLTLKDTLTLSDTLTRKENKYLNIYLFISS
jgi:hypothetical protein